MDRSNTRAEAKEWIDPCWSHPGPEQRIGAHVGRAPSSAERVGFEPTDPLRGHLLSREAQSTWLCHLSVQFAAANRGESVTGGPGTRRKRCPSELGPEPWSPISKVMPACVLLRTWTRPASVTVGQTPTGVSSTDPRLKSRAEHQEHDRSEDRAPESGGGEFDAVTAKTLIKVPPTTEPMMPSTTVPMQPRLRGLETKN